MAGTYSVIVANSSGFVLSSNATLTTLSPTITITALPANVSNATVTVQGTATDKIHVTNVQYQLNGGAWMQPGTTNQWKNWSTNVTLQTGSNIISAYSTDIFGNTSTTNSITVFYVVTSPLTVGVNGTGTTIPLGAKTYGLATNQAMLEVGRGYEIEAVPGHNFIFTNWADGTGAVLTNKALFSFVMSSNLTLNANFVTNPIIAGGAAGAYNGLFYETNGIGEESAGFLNNCIVTAAGGYSGRLYLAGTSYILAGTFDPSGNAHQTITRSGGNSNINVTLHLDWTMGGTRQLTGTISNMDTGNPWSSPLVADLATNALPLPAMRYIMLIPPTTGSPAYTPGGSGYAAITNTTSGLFTSNRGAGGWNADFASRSRFQRRKYTDLRKFMRLQRVAGRLD